MAKIFITNIETPTRSEKNNVLTIIHQEALILKEQIP